MLVPTSKPRDIVILDNLGSHKATAAHRAIRPAGATHLFVPKCSPDLDPTEQLFAKLKHCLPARRGVTRNTLDGKGAARAWGYQ